MKTIMAVGVGLLLAVATAFLAGNQALAPAPVDHDARQWPTVRVVRRDLVETYSNSCVVRPVAEQVVPAPHSGYLRVLVDSGARVSPGTPLYDYRTDVDAMERKKLERKRNLVASQLAFINGRKAQLGRRTLEAKTALIEARSNQLRERIKEARRLHERGEIAESKLKELHNALAAEDANAALERLGAASQAESDRLKERELAFETLALETSLEQLAARMRRQRQAAFSGVVSSVTDPLDRHAQGDSDPWRLVQQGQPLLTIYSTELVAEIEQVPDRVAALATLGAPIEIEQSSRGVTGTGYVVKIDKVPASRLFRLLASIPAHGGGWMRGGGARCTLTVARVESALTIPFRYLLYDERGAYVHPVDGGAGQERTRVVTGVNDGEFVEIVSGLSAGDAVALAPRS